MSKQLLSGTAAGSTKTKEVAITALEGFLLHTNKDGGECYPLAFSEVPPSILCQEKFWRQLAHYFVYSYTKKDGLPLVFLTVQEYMRKCLAVTKETYGKEDAHKAFFLSTSSGGGGSGSGSGSSAGDNWFSKLLVEINNKLMSILRLAGEKAAATGAPVLHLEQYQGAVRALMAKNTVGTFEDLLALNTTWRRSGRAGELPDFMWADIEMEGGQIVDQVFSKKVHGMRPLYILPGADFPTCPDIAFGDAAIVGYFHMGCEERNQGIKRVVLPKPAVSRASEYISDVLQSVKGDVLGMPFDVSSHSTRKGGVTIALDSNVSPVAVTNHTGHAYGGGAVNAESTVFDYYELSALKASASVAAVLGFRIPLSGKLRHIPFHPTLDAATEPGDPWRAQMDVITDNLYVMPIPFPF